MKEIILFLGILVFVYIAWVYTGGPSRFTSRQGPYITPVTRTGEESQGYATTAPGNPLYTNSYPRQVGGETIQTTDGYNVPRFTSRPGATTTSATSYDLHAQ